jgi:hypothetical protein
LSAERSHSPLFTTDGLIGKKCSQAMVRTCALTTCFPQEQASSVSTKVRLFARFV